MNDYWERYEEQRRQHDEKFPNHHEDEIFTCIDCYEMDIAREERERIIALLEHDLDVLPEFARAIELIKGEQK